MKILIADDELDICEAVRRIVERAGHTCIEVYDGALALEAYERERPDLVVLDVMMPEVNGFDLCRDLRAKDARVPIIMLSAKSDIVDKGVGFAAGCDDYVAKPFNSQELAMRIEAQLRRVRLADGDAPRRNRAVVKVGEMEVRLKRNAGAGARPLCEPDAQGVPDHRVSGEPSRRGVLCPGDHGQCVGRRLSA